MKQFLVEFLFFVTSLYVQYIVEIISASTFLKNHEKTCGKVYTKTMKNMMKHIFPTEFFKHPAHFRALVLAMLYTGILVAQLFSYERFSDVTAGFGLPGGETTAMIVAIAVPMLELAALPFLLSMKMSNMWRRVSMYATIMAPVVWLFIGAWQNIAASVDKANSGLFGGTIITSVGVWLIAFSALWLWAVVLTVRELPARN